MPTKKRITKSSAKAARASQPTPVVSHLTAGVPTALKEFLQQTPIPKGFVKAKPVSVAELKKRLAKLHLKPTVSLERLAKSINRIKGDVGVPEAKRSEELRSSVRAMKPEVRRFHGARIALSWFPFPWLASMCADLFGYMTPTSLRDATKLPFNLTSQLAVTELGGLMGDPGRNPNPTSNDPADAGVSNIPAGYTYFGQFVDHDITLDISSTLEAPNDANSIYNMRSPTLDLDSVYARGPGLDPFLYVFPSSGPATAIKFQLGTNRPMGAGGPGSNGDAAGMVAQTDFDVPRMPGSLTAIIGDPRNDENLIVVQFHHAMLCFHNAVVDLLLAEGRTGDIFAEAKRIVILHYQWAVVHDFLERICGAAAVNDALANVVAPIGSAFRMPVEFAVAAYRFGHSMIRDTYWVNATITGATLGEVFAFNRVPLLPVFSTWVVDFNAFFDTGVSMPVHNKARKIDSALAVGLESLPGFTGLMAVLATRNLRRGLALGLPSGQGMAGFFGITPMTTAELTSGLPDNEVTALKSHGGVLLEKTPLWYYLLREAAVVSGGNQMGPVGARIIAETFVRILKRDASSFLNVRGGFAPMLPSAVLGSFTVADLVKFADVTEP